ncbi:hypothetical protein IQ260_20135 [Leptolyngbya cf. ectocarpi LEGE 11479]|uniref:Uncharacterized protein n=1 Tax=Leptolyngbya cf. ectocarpi LEGE 11479 TaxID=1828722 RepID=A0A928ZWU4_LEPEC|nr:hypothetical protein [Leptolyngbya ectocarpi]MBE9068957.1 hypothetical protein [Leptolyngbya cf. ectocarpi LEGE 11479]
MNVLSLFDNALNIDLATGSIDSSASGDPLLTSPLAAIDFDSLLADVTAVANGAIADVDQVVESTTELVIGTLEELNVEIDTVNVSGFIQDIVNFIADLPADATIADVLTEINVPFLSDEEFLDLVTDVSDLINTLAPDLSSLAITPVLEQGVELLEELSTGVGTITINGSSLSGQLTLDGATRTFTTDISDEVDAFLGDVSDFLSGITGRASLVDGQFTGNVLVDGARYALNLDVTAALTDSLTSFFSTAEVTLPFTNGVIAVDFETVLGDVDGTIDFAGGDLDLDLTTPFGTVDTSIEFPEDAQIDVPVALAGLSDVDLELDLAAGLLRVPLLGGIDVSLDMFSGELGFADGMATLTVDNILPTPVSAEFDIGPLASQVAIALTEDLQGELTIDAGMIDGSIISSLGEVDLTASVDDLILQAASVIDQTTGELTLNDGVATVNLDTPFGNLLGGLELVALADTIGNISGLLA